ncbi:hypothetical protein ACHAW6_009578 [Cyclotella cf. meneghiniana]
MQSTDEESNGEKKVSFSDIGGLHEKIWELREVIGIDESRFVCEGGAEGVLLYGPPGMGKTLLAKALASKINATFLKVVAYAIVDKYIGESAHMIRKMFGFAFGEGTSADREIQRTLMELLNQMDGFEDQGQVKMVMATNCSDILDPALLCPERLDRTIEIPKPNESQRLEILNIQSAGITKCHNIDFESVVKLADGLNGAVMRNVCTEAGLFAIRSDRDYVLE